jgi:copper resistance protein C
MFYRSIRRTHAARRSVWATLASFALAATFSQLALAHATLVKSDPGRRAVLVTAPKQIRLWFNEKLEPAYSSITVTDANDRPVGRAAAVVSKDDAKLLTLAIGEVLPPGRYKVSYRALSVDGHVVDSSFSFTIKPGP